MDTLINIRTFLAVARSGSFSAAGRHLGVAPSVVTKRISRLEDQMRVKLFVRSTRQLILTEVGERYLPRYQSLVKDIDDAIGGAAAVAQRIEGHLRIKAPTTVTIAFLARILSDFQQENPNVTMDVALVDRSVNPAKRDMTSRLAHFRLPTPTWSTNRSVPTPANSALLHPIWRAAASRNIRAILSITSA
ncbi:LysR family transcriptional regulator [Neorhizobium huautlense]|uniref:LysR family transcriptional regulator n=1 Tax=Neorhizobium huautlense TaxID=67774 RepID=UPI00197B57E9|nr:LysR family transcriptional regulator [Neorhizobium huautlense]